MLRRTFLSMLGVLPLLPFSRGDRRLLGARGTRVEDSNVFDVSLAWSDGSVETVKSVPLTLNDVRELHRGIGTDFPNGWKPFTFASEAGSGRT